MLAIDKIRVLEGITIYSDDEDETKFYLMPDVPRFRMNDTGKPSFAYYKYRMPIDRTDGSKGGGFLVCDVEFSVTEEKRAAIVKKLNEELAQRFPNRDPKPEAKIGAMTYTKGTAKLNIENIGEKFVEGVFNPGKPSLYGRNITPFTVELTDLGATFFEQALQNQGGFVQVAYDLYAPVKLPPIEVHIWFIASKFLEFTQDFTKRTRRQGAFASVWRWFFGGTSGNRTTINQSMEEEAREYQWG
ncbi:hypothetical protein H6F43_10390, partial [Leptolyngbya sp. FACHB-36]|uniref:hypothetical protein n=1 Tax=Leptolyngbya sp. FACHB-36 TaxID=2692808 RepID=UPI0016800FCA